MTQFKTELEKFDPKIVELQKIAETAKAIVVTDLKDKKQLDLVRTQRIELKGLRVNIEKTGKALRDDANTFNKAVLKKQHEMIDIIEPEEKRLAEIEGKAEKLAEIDKRKESLPKRKERLAEITDGVTIKDEEILEMDDANFFAYVNERVANWNAEQVRVLEEQREADRVKKEKEAQEAEEIKRLDALKEVERKEKEEAERLTKEEEANAKIDAENAKIKAEQEAVQAKIDAEKEAIEKEKREIAHKKELEETRKKAEVEAEILAELKIKAEQKAEAERLAIEEAKKDAEEKSLAKRKEFQMFLAKHDYTEKTKADFHISDDGTKVTLYKKVGTFNK